MRYAFIFFAVLVAVCAEAQQINIKTSIYFDTDSSNLTTDHHKRLNKLADTIKKLNVQGILLRGNTDADADSMYNIRLSAKRVNAVKNYLATKNIDTAKFKLDYYGENKPIADNETDVGKQKNRRVDIILSALVAKPKPTNSIKDTTAEVTVIKPVAEDTCAKDTTYTLPQGTMVTMSLCDYNTMGQCITIAEYLTPESIRGAGLMTESNTGELLQSGGMINIRTCNGQCLPKPVTVRIPIDEKLVGKDYKQMQLYDASPNGWVLNRQQSSGLKIVKIGKQKYYEFTVQCPGGKNLDKLLCGAGSDCGRKYKIKLPKGYKLITAQISATNELWQTTLGFARNKRKSKTCFLCGKLDKNLMLYVKAINSNGDTAIMNYKPLKDIKYRYRIFPGRCRKPFKKQCGNFLQVFGYRKSKFKIREKDFDEVIPSKKENKP